MFLWKNKFLVLLLLLIGAYFYTNPADRFGIVRPQLVVYNRIPVFFFDFFVGFDGETELYDDVSEPLNFTYFWRNEGKGLRTEETKRVFLMGTGFKERASFDLEPAYEDSLLMSGLHIMKTNNHDAARKYNELREQGRDVAILLKLQ